MFNFGTLQGQFPEDNISISQIWLQKQFDKKWQSSFALFKCEQCLRKRATTISLILYRIAGSATADEEDPGNKIPAMLSFFYGSYCIGNCMHETPNLKIYFLSSNNYEGPYCIGARAHKVPTKRVPPKRS
jgi:hypothetical protein